MDLMRDKRVGKVLLIVEGAKHEFNLIKRIFVDVLGYTQIEKRRNNTDYYVRKGDVHSVVAIVNTKASNIASINEEEYLDIIFEELIEKHNFDINNAAIYYLFDRDPESNIDGKLIVGLIDKLKNSRENDNNMRGGMLILSYPAVEAYEISNFIDKTYELKARLGSELKEYINKNAKIISMNKINRESIIHAGKEMISYLRAKGIGLDLDDFSNMNRAVFMNEEQCFAESNTYKILSMLSCVLMDLGILREIINR